MDDLALAVELARQLHAVLRERGLTLASAESCTGGLLGHVLTEVPGASEWYVGGTISYSDHVKQAQLGVPEETLARHGAVSAQTCVAMADGARRRYGSALTLAVTGIAGPSGGTPSKPVGLTYVAVADEDGHDVRRHRWHGDRHSNKVRSVTAGLELVLDRLEAR